jgi:hypothetical protein
MESIAWRSSLPRTFLLNKTLCPTTPKPAPSFVQRLFKLKHFFKEILTTL